MTRIDANRPQAAVGLRALIEEWVARAESRSLTIQLHSIVDDDSQTNLPRYVMVALSCEVSQSPH